MERLREEAGWRERMTGEGTDEGMEDADDRWKEDDR